MNQSRTQKSAEEIQNWNMVFPNQANPNGNMFGGDLLAIMDTTAAMAAKRFSQLDVSTVAVEAVHFASPLKVGDNIKTTAKVVAVGNTSMLVKTQAFRDIGQNGLLKCVSAYFSLVAFDASGKPALVPSLILQEMDKKANNEALLVKHFARKRNEALT